MRGLVLAILLATTGCVAQPVLTSAGPVGPETGRWRQQDYAVPFHNEDGSTTFLAGRVCRPDRPGPAPLVVIAHGAPPVASDRDTMRLGVCDGEAISWFLARGFAVIATLRRGYGATGGAYFENNPACTVDGYAHAARESARDLQATIHYAITLPGIRPDRVTLVGQSAGGWAALGLDSLPHAPVTALVSMAGGRGGHYRNVPDSNCHPENLEAAAGELGHTARTPMLWIFTANDSYFAPPIAQAMHAAFTAAGGTADFNQLGPYDRDGHRLFFGRGGSAIWGPLIDRYLRERGVL